MDLPSPVSSLAKTDCTAKPPGLWRVGTLVYTGLGLAILFCWLLWGDFAWSLKERAVVPVAQLMLKRFAASDFLVGLLVGSLPAALGMVLGPVISVKSDRHRGRWGRRIPFLLIPTPIAVLSMMGLALTPVLGAWLHEALGTYAPNRFVLNLAIFSFFWTTFEIATIIANTIFGGLINDVVPQEVIGRFFGMFRAVSLLAGILFNYCLMGHAEEHFVAIFLGIGLLYGVGFALMCCKVKEGSYPPPEVAAERGVHPLLEIQTYLRECFSNPYYVWVFVGMTFATLASGPFNSFCLFYVKSIGMDLDAYGKYIALTYVISLVLSYPMGMLADRFHPLRMGMLATGLYSVAMIAGWCFARSVGSFAVALVLHGVLSGMFFTCTASLGQRLFPRAKFAQFASANGIIGALAFLVMPPLVGALLDFTGHAYRYTFVIGGVLALVGLVSLTVVYYKFMRLGGPRGYVAPEPAVKPAAGSNRLDI